MEERITGSWPGGPKREGDAHKRTRPPRLRRAEDIEAGLAARSVRIRHGARSRRIAIGLGVSLAVAGGFGWVLGKASHRTAEEVISEYATARRRDLDISAEVNRTLLELWKMENVQAARNGGRIR